MVDGFLFGLVAFAYSSNFLLLWVTQPHTISFIYIFTSNTIKKPKNAHNMFFSNIFISFWWDCVGKEKDLCFTNSTPSSLIQIYINFLWDVTYSKSEIKDESLIYFTLLFLVLALSPPMHLYNKYLSICVSNCFNFIFKILSLIPTCFLFHHQLVLCVEM